MYLTGLLRKLAMRRNKLINVSLCFAVENGTMIVSVLVHCNAGKKAMRIRYRTVIAGLVSERSRTMTRNRTCIRYIRIANSNGQHSNYNIINRIQNINSLSNSLINDCK